MKNLLKSGLVLALGLLLHSGTAQAQVRVNVNIPVWGPPVPTNVQYYYIPEIDGYYDLYTQSYLFFDPAYGAWISSPVLPRAYASYDPRFFHPVVIQYVGRQPWGYLPDHRAYCNNWGVQPGRYYGPNWPGRGYSYSVGPRGAYRNDGYYGGRPYNQGGYARGDYRDDRGGYYGNRNDNRGGYDRDDRGGYDRNDRNGNDRGGYDNRSSQNAPGNYNAPNNQASQGGQRVPGNYNNGASQSSGGRGRGRLN